MVPRASKNFEQRQPITTTLRSICESYPANTSLKELLQNADDARASEFEIVLDTNSYAGLGPFLHEELVDYSGPAVLARNNSVFTDRDFESLSSVGDSCKRHDPESTGKFGQGFNSVYHWSDGPQIYSRDTLLILDPHRSWSRDTEQPGGPAWDVTHNHDCIEMTNQLATFGAFQFDPSQILSETIVRIPLRTPTQAKTSKIKQHAPQIDEIEQILRQFCKEIEQGQLLFLKNVCKVTVRINQDVLLTAHKTFDDQNKRAAVPKEFGLLYSSGNRPKADVALKFETKITYEHPTGSRSESFLVQHYMARSCGDPHLNRWAKEWKLFPWVAVAAPIGGQVDFAGGLFSTLKLPLDARLPVHIHGLFAIAPDRARLGFEPQAIAWNTFLFREVVSIAWSKILEHQCQESRSLEQLTFWPAINQYAVAVDLWNCLDDFVIDKVIARKARVWKTTTNCFSSLEDSFLKKQSPEDCRFATALVQAGVSTILLAPDFFDKVERRANLCNVKLQPMKPSAVRMFLLRNISSSAPIGSVGPIVEFLLLDMDTADLATKQKIYGDLGAIAIWPTLNGTLSKAQSLLLPRDLDELRLFASARPSSTVDIRKLAQKTLQLLSRDMRLLKPMMRHRDPASDLTEDWPAIYAKPSQSDATAAFTERVIQQDSVLRNIWIWVLRHSGKFPNGFDSHWFIPVKHSKIRRFRANTQVAPTLIVLQDESMAEVLDDIESHAMEPAPTILDSTVLSNEAIRFLSSVPRDKFCYAALDDVQSLARWLFAARHSLTRLGSESRKKILSHLSEITPENISQQPYFAEVQCHLRQLPIFTKTTCKLAVRSINVGALKEDCGLIFELPGDLPTISDHPGVCLCDLSFDAERKLLLKLRLVEISREELLKQFLLPWMQSESDAVAKKKVADWIFSIPNSKLPTSSWIANVLSQPIVPLDSGPNKWGRLSDLIDPQSSFSDMFFRDENVFPDKEFYDRHRQTLLICGLSNGSDASLIDRVKAFSKRKEKPEDMKRKVECLFTKSPGNNFNWQPNTIKMLRQLAWIPGWSPDNTPTLHSPAKCRPNESAHLVDRVWGRIPFQGNAEWSWLLGWNQEPPPETVLKQLDLCLQANDKVAIERLIPYLVKFDAPTLSSRAVVLGSQGKYFTAEKVFYPGEKLRVHSVMPYLDRVDTNFSSKYPQFLSKLPIKTEPSIEDLRGVQDRILEETQSELTEELLAAVIATLEVAALLSCDPEEFAKLLIPDVTMKLRELRDIVHGDRISSGETNKFNFTHPALSEALINKLGIESCFERANRLQIDWEDQDEDEFVPRETLSTTINDTLNRYPIESTFNEFLANADDAKAKAITWILDESHTHHPSNSLLTKELAQFQGAALFCHNDSVFSESDFKGFRDIGNGGKKDDELSTGMFGRGALSMYHFTDVPMIISAGYLLIIDPQQLFLPRNRFHKRKPGVKLSLASVRSVAPDQLAPFDGIKGFRAKVDEAFEGTIFRFPLRNSNAQSMLKEDGEVITSKGAKDLIQDYLGIAQSSLLFLSNVNRIEFSIRGKEQPEWSVSAIKSDLSSNSVFEKVTMVVDKEQLQVKNEWHIGIEELVSTPPDIPKPWKMRGKITECGVAAWMGRETSGPLDASLQKLDRQQRVFCRLPTDTVSSLPVSFHSSFAITGDRRSIPFMETDQFSKWNKWLIEPLSALYVNFLEHLAPQIGAEVFRHWPLFPRGEIDKSLSDVVARLFWNRIGAKHLLDKLFPCNAPVSTEHTRTNSSRTKTRKVRKRHLVTTLQSASFDFLSPSKSALLEPLFELLGIDLVRPGIRLERGLRHVANSIELSFIDAQWVSRTFKREANALLLDHFLSTLSAEDKNEALAVIFEILQPVLRENSKDDSNGPKCLDGCWILPRPGLDSPLGRLKVVGDDKENEWHLAATSKERELFSFARTRFIHYPLRFRREGTAVKESPPEEGFAKDLLSDVLTGPFNIRKLNPEDLGGLLALEGSPAKSIFDSDIRDDWNLRFWKYLNSGFLFIKDKSPTAVLEQTRLWNTAVYRTRGKDNKWRYLSPRDFENGPCIVKPDDNDQYNMCSSIPGLICVDPLCLPEGMKGKYLKDCHESFSRFLLALTRLGSFKQILEGCLSRPCRQLLLELAVSFVDKLSLSQNNDLVLSKRVLRQLPIWPRLSRPEHSQLSEFIAAEDAVLCGHVDMFQSFVKGLDNYIEPGVVMDHANHFKKLGLTLKSVEEFWPFVSRQFPATLVDEQSRRDFVRLVRYMISHGLQKYTLPALDGNSRLCAPNEVYDHEDAIFQSAFYRERHRFLHPDVQILRSYWLAKGLRSRSRENTLSARDYLECLLAFDRFRQASPADPALDGCGRTVTDYLRFENPEFSRWERSIWAQISKIPVFLTARTINQRAYRQPRMQQLSLFKYYSSLEEVGQIGDIRLFWSQLRLLQVPLPSAVYGLRPQGAKPPVHTVYEHVRYLVSICNGIGNDMSEFLEDIKASYNYLQAETETFVGLPGVRDAPIWLNISTTSSHSNLSEDLRPNFLSARQICLNAPDDVRHLKVARSFLLPYEKVLRALGCQAVVDLPEIEATSDTSIDSPLSQSWGKIRDMRTKSALCDVVFEAEGQHVPAHRIILASASRYCETQFLGPWGHQTDHTVIHLEDISAATLTALIDFAYTGDVHLPSVSSGAAPVKNDKVADILDDSLDLLVAADYWGMTHLHQRIESYILAPGNNRQFVRVENVGAVQRVAESAQAQRLVKWCRDFRKANKEWVLEFERQAKEEESKQKQQ